MGEGNDNAGSPLLVTEWLASGRVRLAIPGEEFPPRAVVDRLGGWARWRDIRKVDVGGKTVWVGRPTFGETMVLDDKGHLVRAKKVLAVALSA